MLRDVYAGRLHASGLGLNQTIEASLVLGAHLLGWKRQRRLAALISSPDVDLAAVLGKGGALLEPWPAAWHAFLGEELGRRFQGVILPSLEAAFGPVHGLIRSGGGWRTALGDELARYAVGRREVTVKKGRSISRAVEGNTSGQWLCLDEAAARMGVARSAAIGIARRLGSERAPGRIAGKYVIEASAVEELVQANKTYGEIVSLKEAAEVLGLGGPGCAALISTGLLSEVPVKHRINLGLSICRAAVDALLAAFDRSASNLPVVDQPKGYYRVGGRGSSGGFGNRAIVAGVVAGELSPVAIWSGATGIARYLFLHQTSRISGRVYKRRAHLVPGTASGPIEVPP